jgi:hypothetical protein
MERLRNHSRSIEVRIDFVALAENKKYSASEVVFLFDQNTSLSTNNNRKSKSHESNEYYSHQTGEMSDLECKTNRCW